LVHKYLTLQAKVDHFHKLLYTLNRSAETYTIFIRYSITVSNKSVWERNLDCDIKTLFMSLWPAELGIILWGAKVWIY